MNSRQKFSRFVSTDHGELSPISEESVQNTHEFGDNLESSVQTTENHELSALNHSPNNEVESSSSASSIVEAQAWVRNANGQLILHSPAASTNAQRIKLFTVTCQ